MRVRLGQTTGIALMIAAVALLAASAAAVILSLAQVKQTRALVLRTAEILQTTETLQRNLRTAETGQRGYLLTGDPSYLAPYEQARRRIPDNLERLRALVRDPGQVRRLAALAPLMEAKLRELHVTVELGRRSRAAALQVVRTGEGQRHMQAFEAAAAEFQAAEQDLMAARMAADQRAAEQAAVAAGATVVLAFLAMAAGVGALLRQRNLAALERANALLESKVAERTESLTRANRELDAFAYTISHDLRAPLRGMQGYATAIEEDYGAELPEEALQALRRIGAAAERMNQLIEDILAYARLAREELSVRPVALSSVVERARRQLPPECAPASVTVDGVAGEVLAHPVALQQAVLNLLSNGCKYAEPGRPNEVRVRSESSGDRVRLWVEDNGIGIAPEHQARIFQPFERLHGIESYAGTGIGLAIVARAIERMGGDYGVESALGRGSRFWIELKASEPHRE